MNENASTPLEMSEQDIKDLASLEAEPAATNAPEAEQVEYHTVLQVWRDVLAPAAAVASERVQPSWANKIMSQYLAIGYADMNHYRRRYFAKLEEMKAILAAEIATDDECLNRTTVEEDQVDNAQHYKNLLRDWQKAVLAWEIGWDCEDPEAAVEVAAIAEVHKLVFSHQGITAFLDNIAFEFTEADQQELAADLDAFKAEREAARSTSEEG